ncbi:MAG: hypothetical protein ACD_40C00053G0011 [uncultured bacterium]|nr:MAG: hypothetical protein ACD_40C00053G0011 [uncultured bacterium]KKU15136.1 MAG: hypothetical protein UX21_C0006G0029 [Microgenomates group bacterium GW2011_GWC2_45_8]KKU26342.1 MAG: hypothetical protein UX37_C0003G0028 [Microgenomates group bacterium GW2011_GWA2_46_16]
MKKKTKVLNYRVILEQDEDGVFVANVPSLQGCYTQGKSFEEAMKNIREVIELHLKVKKDLLNEPDDTLTEFVGIKNISIPSSYGTFAHI